MSTTPTSPKLTPFEREVMQQVIAEVPEPKLHSALMRQLEALRVKERDYTGVGFFTYFECPPELRSIDIAGAADEIAPAVDLTHRRGWMCVTFVLRFNQDGFIDCLEGVATLTDGMERVTSETWPAEVAAAGLWPQVGTPISFDPADNAYAPTEEDIAKTKRRLYPELRPFERAALNHLIAVIADEKRRETLLRQLETLKVQTRLFTGVGFVTYFADCPPALRLTDERADDGETSPVLRLNAPDGQTRIDFDFSLRAGALWELHVSARGGSWWSWREEDCSAGLWPDTRAPILFDPVQDGGRFYLFYLSVAGPRARAVGTRRGTVLPFLPFGDPARGRSVEKVIPSPDVGRYKTGDGFTFSTFRWPARGRSVEKVIPSPVVATVPGCPPHPRLSARRDVNASPTPRQFPARPRRNIAPASRSAHGIGDHEIKSAPVKVAS